MQKRQKKANQKAYGFSEARYRCIKYLPYAYSHVASLIPVQRPGLGTIAVDRHMRVYYDPAMFADRPIDECTASILHEDLHVLLRHFERATEHLGSNSTPQQWRRWNEACDLTVNQTLRKAGVPIPDGWLVPERYGFAENLSVEQYYDMLGQQGQDETPHGSASEDEGDKQGGEQPPDQGDDDAASDGESGDSAGQGEDEQESGDSQTEGKEQEGSKGGPSGTPYDGDLKPAPGTGTGGSGADGQARPWECPPPGQCDTPGMDDYDQQMIQRAVAVEIDRRAKDKGDVSGYLTRFAQEKLHPKVDPFKALHAAVKYAVTATTGRGDYTWRRLPRRSPPGGLRLPSPVKPVPRTTVIVDTSGSMGQRELAKALGVVEQGLRSLPSGSICVLTGDTCVQSAKNVFRGEQVELNGGGGGTGMAALIEEAARQRPAPDAIVVVTDGWTRWPKNRLRPRVVACLTEEPGSERYRVPE